MFLKRLGNRIGGNVIPLQGVPPDPQQFAKHADAVAQWMDARAFAMRPCDRDLTNDESEFRSQVEQLRIKAPAFDFLQWEDDLRAAPGESLEATLRIFELQTQYRAQRQVEDSPEEPAM